MKCFSVSTPVLQSGNRRSHASSLAHPLQCVIIMNAQTGFSVVLSIHVVLTDLMKPPKLTITLTVKK